MTTEDQPRMLVKEPLEVECSKFYVLYAIIEAQGDMRSCPEYALLVFQGKATKPREEQVVVRIVNEAARDQAGRGDAGGSRVPNVRRVCRVKETSRAKSIRRNEEQQDYDSD